MPAAAPSTASGSGRNRSGDSVEAGGVVAGSSERRVVERRQAAAKHGGSSKAPLHDGGTEARHGVSTAHQHVPRWARRERHGARVQSRLCVSIRVCIVLGLCAAGRSVDCGWDHMPIVVRAGFGQRSFHC